VEASNPSAGIGFDSFTTKIVINLNQLPDIPAVNIALHIFGDGSWTW